MCYWVGTKKVKNELMKRKGQFVDESVRQLLYDDLFRSGPDFEFQEHWIAMAHSKPQLSAVIYKNGQYHWKNFRWTMGWGYHTKEGDEKHYQLPLVRTEKVFQQHTHNLQFNRCVVPIDGYFEYYRKGPNKYPFYIYPPENDVWFAAGFYAPVSDIYNLSGVESCALMTVTANDFVRKIHNAPVNSGDSRMLLLLSESEAFRYLNSELTGKELKSFFNPFPDDQMLAHPVLPFQRRAFSQFVNSEKVREHFHYPELAV